MERIWENIEQIIQSKYQLKGDEWVQVSVSKRGKIHVTVVSDSNIKRTDIKKSLEEELDKKSDSDQIGFINIYSTEQAEELHIEKIRKMMTTYPGQMHYMQIILPRRTRRRRR